MSLALNAEPLKRAYAAAEADLQHSYGGDYNAMARAWPAFVVLILRAEIEARERHSSSDANRFVKYLNDTLKQHHLPFQLSRHSGKNGAKKPDGHWADTPPQDAPNGPDKR